VFYRNPFNVEENLFVNVSSPSSSKFQSVADLGSPEEAARKTQEQARGLQGACALAAAVAGGAAAQGALGPRAARWAARRCLRGRTALG
jgi:hypothetical protein